MSFTNFEKVVGTSGNDRMDLWWLNPGGTLSPSQELALQDAGQMPVHVSNDPNVAQADSDARMYAAGQIDQNKIGVTIDGGGGSDMIQGTRTGIDTIKGGAGKNNWGQSRLN